MLSDIGIKSMLIDEYEKLMRIRKLAVKDNAAETLEEIDRNIEYIRVC